MSFNEKESIFHVLSPEERAKVMVVVSPPYPGAGFQKHQVHLLSQDKQKPNPSPEALAKMSDLKALSNLSGNQIPSFSFFLPAMQLRSGAQKLAGPGVFFNQKENAVPDLTKGKHQAFLICTTEGASEELCNFYGGRDKFHELQLEAHRLLCDAEVEFERKRFFHPLSMDEATKQKKLETARKANKDPNMTMEQCLEVLFQNHISDHESVRLTSNFAEDPNGPREKSFLLTSNCWYTPKQKPTPEDNDKLIATYRNNAKKHKFSVNDEMIRGYGLGLRYRQIPCFARTSLTSWERIMPQNVMEYPARGGDFVVVKMSMKFYDAASKGRRLDVDEIYIMQQNETQNQLSKPVDPKMHNLPLFKRRRLEEDHEEETVKEPTENAAEEADHPEE